MIKKILKGTVRSRLVLLALIAVLPVTVMTILHGYHHLNLTIAQVKKSTQHLASIVNSDLETSVDSAHRLLLVFSRTEPVRNLDAKACTKLFESMVAQFEEVYPNIVLIAPDGKALAHGLPHTPLADYKDRSWFQATLKNKAFTTGNFVLGKTTKRAIIPVGLPVYNESGELHCVLATAIGLDEVGRELSDAAFPAGSIITVIDDSGSVLARDPPRPDFLGNNYADKTIIQEILARKKGTVETVSIDGEKRLMAFTPLLPNRVRPSYVYVGIPTETIYTPVYRYVVRQLAWLAVVACFGVFMALMVGKHCIIMPIKNLIGVADAYGNGDMTQRSPEDFAVAEFAQLGTTFNRMAEQLNTRQEDLVRQSKKLQRSNRDLEHFAYVASHDLQEPLRKVTSFSELLVKRFPDLVDEKAQHYIDYIVDGASRMSKLINHLLEYSRVTTKGHEFELIACKDLVGQVLSNLELQIKEADARITCGDLPSVMGDGVQLAQVFQNLISNAIKFRGDRPPSIHIDAERRNSEYEFSVCDNGIGVAEDQQERIFLMFQRLHSAGAYPGEGIGLALCKRIIERHGGRIWVKSTPGTGSTFFFTIKTNNGETA